MAWAKLGPRELYARTPFEPGILYEDSYSMPQHLSAVDEVVVTDTVVYGYIPRKGSISNPHEMTEEHAQGKFRTIAQLREMASGWPPELRRLSVLKLQRHLLGLMGIASLLPDRRRARAYWTRARRDIRSELPPSGT